MGQLSIVVIGDGPDIIIGPVFPSIDAAYLWANNDGAELLAEVFAAQRELGYNAFSVVYN